MEKKLSVCSDFLGTFHRLAGEISSYKKAKRRAVIVEMEQETEVARARLRAAVAKAQAQRSSSSSRDMMVVPDPTSLTGIRQVVRSQEDTERLQPGGIPKYCTEMDDDCIKLLEGYFQKFLNTLDGGPGDKMEFISQYLYGRFTDKKIEEKLKLVGILVDEDDDDELIIAAYERDGGSFFSGRVIPGIKIAYQPKHKQKTKIIS